MTDSLRELLPCPFCGGKPYETRTVNGTEMYLVGCASCGIELKAAWYRGEPRPTKNIAGLWNRRALLAETPPSDQGLREAVLCHMERIKHDDRIARDVIAHNGWEHADGDPCNVCSALARPSEEKGGNEAHGPDYGEGVPWTDSPTPAPDALRDAIERKCKYYESFKYCDLRDLRRFAKEIRDLIAPSASDGKEERG
jgi:hypothetical protein